MAVSPSRVLARGRGRVAALAAALLAALVPVITPAARAAAPAPAAGPSGYWLVASDGGIFAFGDAGFFGSTGSIALNQPITGMAPTQTGQGYWLTASDGGIFAFGDAKFYGSTGSIKLNKPITGMAPTPTGNGYWLTASDGGIFAFGDARFFGSTGAMSLNKPITGMAPTPTGNGYWLTASDGGIFAFGDAGYFGAAPSRPAVAGRSVVSMVPTATGAGYWQASATGELLAFGDAADLGGVSHLSRPIVAMAAVPAGSTVTGAGSNDVGPTGAPATTATTARPGPAPGPAPGPTSTTSTSTTTSSSSTTTTTFIPAAGPKTFSSTAKVGWGTPLDPARSGYAEEVRAILEVGDKVFVAGEFTNLVDPGGAGAAPARPFLVALDAATGAPLSGSAFNANANPDGPVFALAASPDGHRLYVGGKFASIGGRSMRRLAALDADTGLVDPTFTPPTPSAYLNALEVSQGRLYLGGAFSTLLLAGTPVPRQGLAALDAATGALITDFVPPVNYGGVFETHTGKAVEDQPGTYNPGVVNALAATNDGTTLMVAGNFLHFGTAPADDPDHQHGGLIAVDPVTGSLTPWQPVSKRPVFGLAVWPGDGRTIFTAAGGTGGVVQAFVPGGTKFTPKWTGHVDGDAQGVAATTTRVYLVGHYDHEVPNAKDPCLTTYTPQPPDGHLGISCPDGDPHRHLAAFDAKTGMVDPTFTAQADTNEGPSVAVIGARNLYVGGNFLKVSDTPGANYRAQPGLAIYPAIS